MLSVLLIDLVSVLALLPCGQVVDTLPDSVVEARVRLKPLGVTVWDNGYCHLRPRTNEDLITLVPELSAAGVTGIKLKGLPDATVQSAAALRQITTLQRLYLERIPVSDQWMAHLATLPSLEQLGVSVNPADITLTSRSIELLSASPSLRVLSIWNR